MKEKEIWLPIEGYEECYLISNKGRVFSKTSNRMLKGGFSHGYPYIKMCKKGTEKSERIHRLVAMAFIPRTNKNKKEVNHKDCDKTNNNVENLEWVTRRENLDHSVIHYNLLGSNVGKSKLVDEQVLEIFNKKEASRMSLSKKFKVSTVTIWKIRTGRSWSWLTGCEHHNPSIKEAS